jgi:subtilisin family serine protease
MGGKPGIFAFLFLLAAYAAVQRADAQQRDYVTHGWQLADYREDSVFGAGVTRVYRELLKGKKSHPVVVALIDDGVDTTHEDLAGHIWINKREIPGNGLDDDHNGYVDDVHGWNFLGGRDGRNITVESFESYREYYRLNHLSPGSVDSPAERDSDRRYRESVAAGFLRDSARQAHTVASVERMIPRMRATDSLLRKALHKDSIYMKDLRDMEPSDSLTMAARKSAMQYFWKYGIASDMPLGKFIKEAKNYLEETRLELGTFSGDPNARRRDIVGDDYNDINDRYYGNNNVAAGNPFHGTHVAGIIAASRDNGKGIDGIADNVLIMPVRAVPSGDERDKDIALAIRYAVDNGAQIVNMSFGKYFSPQKKWVDEAEQYAEDHDVLLVHLSGNDALDIDSIPFYPDPGTGGSQGSSVFITVAASTGGPDSLVPARFSSYGHASVDLYAPGVKIYSTVPDNQYETYSGTSMAAPVVTGVAALLLEYYPKLSARQLKYVITHSVMPLPNPQVKLESGKTVDFRSLSVSGGVVNAYNAFKLAARLRGERGKKPKNDSHLLHQKPD